MIGLSRRGNCQTFCQRFRCEIDLSACIWVAGVLIKMTCGLSVSVLLLRKNSQGMLGGRAIQNLLRDGHVSWVAVMQILEVSDSEDFYYVN